MSEGKQLDELLDDKGNWTSTKCVAALTEIFKRFESTAGAGWTEPDLQKSANITNGRPFNAMELEQVKEVFAPLASNGNITLEGFLSFYKNQTVDHPEETWKDLRKFGYNNNLDLISQADKDKPAAAGSASAGTGGASESKAEPAAAAAAGAGAAAAASAAAAPAAPAEGKADAKGDAKSAGESKAADPDPSVRPGFKLVLVDMQKPLCEHFARMFRNESKKDQLDPNVQIVCGRFEHLAEFDCMVSAANSFGLMDGGVDGAITMFFGDQLQKRVQKHIVDNFDGEQPVGTSFIIESGHSKHRWLAHTPTMRVPYSIQGLDNVYLAMKAMLRAVWDHNQKYKSEPKMLIKTVACTGFGTYYGKMELEEAARQQYLAWRGFVSPPKQMSWDFATDRQRDVRYGGFDMVLRYAASLQKQRERELEAFRSRVAISGNMDAFAMLTKGLNKGGGDS